MKNDKHINDIDQLLDLVEHAGRDARRQQQIYAMIEQMAAEGGTTKHHSTGRNGIVRRWAIRIAAAACVTGFIITTFHFINQSSPALGVITAGIGNPPALSPVSHENVPAYKAPDVVAAAVRKPTASPLEAMQNSPASEMLAEKEAVDDTASAVEEPFVPEILENSLLAETPVYDPIVENGDDPVDSIQESVPDDIATQQPSQPEKRRRGLFRLRQAEPSNMQGTSFTLFAMNL